MEETLPPAHPSPADLCPYPRPFPSSFDACVAFQPQVFVAATSRGEPLGTHVGCVHLRAGEAGRNKFYGRCVLGDLTGRQRWLATLGPGRLEVLRSLREEFEEVAERYRSPLVAAKARSLASPADLRARAALDDLVAEFLGACEQFLTERAARYQGAGFPVAELRELLRQVVDGWRPGTSLDATPLDESQLQRFSPALRVFLGGSARGRARRVIGGRIDDSDIATLERSDELVELAPAQVLGSKLEQRE